MTHLEYVEKFINKARGIIPLNVLRKEIDSNIYKLQNPGSGWKSLQNSLEEDWVTVGGLKKKFESILEEYIINGKKKTFIYTVSKDNVELLKSDVYKLKTKGHGKKINVYSKNFPYSIPKAYFDDKESNPIHLTKVKSTEKGIYFVLSSFRHTSLKDELDESYIKEDLLNELRKKYDKILCVSKRKKSQVNDVIFIPRDFSRIEVRVDSSSIEEAAPCCKKIIESISRKGIPKKFFNKTHVLTKGLMSYIYKHVNSEVNIVELGFNCSSGTSRHEYFRRENSDLRDEMYHKYGAKHVNISPYKMYLRWDKEIQPSALLHEKLGVILNGNYNQYIQGNEYLFREIITVEMFNEEQFFFATENLMKYYHDYLADNK